MPIYNTHPYYTFLVGIDFSADVKIGPDYSICTLIKVCEVYVRVLLEFFEIDANGGIKLNTTSGYWVKNRRFWHSARVPHKFTLTTLFVH